MALEKIIEYATVFGAKPKELENSNIPDFINYEVCTFGYIDERETFVSFYSGVFSKNNEYGIGVYPDTSGDWTKRIPLLVQKLAQETGGKIKEKDPDASEIVILSKKPTQAEVANWVKKFAKYFDNNKLTIDRIRYFNIPNSVREKSLFGERMKINIL